jgi:transposase
LWLAKLFWVHSRRKFIDVGKASKNKNSQAVYAIKLIAKLYAIEKSLAQASPEVRYQGRLEKSKPVIDKLKHWLGDIRPKVAPQDNTGQGVALPRPPMAKAWLATFKMDAIR